MDVAHAERPVRHPYRQPVDGDFHHEAVRHFLEVDRVVVETEAAAQVLEPAAVVLQPAGHGQPASSRARWLKNARMPSHTDSLPVSAKLADGLPAASSAAKIDAVSVCSARSAVAGVST